jgi:CMP-N,N'-diacetyllegionaminic acid synthase
MNALAIIPARGGSKRLPGKNVRLLGGIPLIAWTVGAALQGACFGEVLVSTDDARIAEVAREYGASVPWMRPAALSTDTAGTVDVALHALEDHEARRGPVRAIVLLQPTSPFRSPDAITRALALFDAHDGQRPVVSVVPARSHPSWTFRIVGDYLEPFLPLNISRRSQDLEAAWTLNGSIYVISPQRLRKENAFLTEDMLPLVMDAPGESVDIDTLEDFEICEFMLERGRTTHGR